MQQILALDVNLRATRLFTEPLGVVKRSRPACVVGEQVLEFGLKCRIVPGFQIRLLELLERSHQELGHITTAIGSEVALWIWLGRNHDCRAAFTNWRTLSWSFKPG